VDRKKTSEKNSVLENGKMVTASSHWLKKHFLREGKAR
jgi:hypothetical protein